MKRNIPIEFFRFLFICVICLWHFSNVATFVKHGYIAVEFFFILSGFYLYKNYRKNPEIETIDYLLSRCKKLLPPFLISFLLLVLLDRKQYIYPPEEISPDSILEKYFSHFHEIFLCQGIGLTDRAAINHPLWFVSVLLFSSCLLHSMLRNYGQKAINLFIPIIVLVGLNYLLAKGGRVDAPIFCSPWLRSGIVRGLSEMGLGIIISNNFEKKYYTIVKKKIIFNLLGLASLLGFMLMILAEGNYDYLSFFFVPIIIVCCNMQNSVFQKLFSSRIWVWFGNLSMFMYFIHLFVAYIFWMWFCNLGIPTALLVVMYIIGVVFAAYFLKRISKFFLPSK